MTAALEGSEWSAASPGRTLPLGKTRYPLYTRLGGPQGRSGRAENLAPPGFDPRTVQPVAQSLYRLSYPAHTQAEVQIYYKIQNDSCKLYSSKLERRVDALGKIVHYCTVNVYLYIGLSI